uniref:Uncharacterized protein n=1 Tax=uncultured marine group II/III euryarchaeote AD1000_49_G12 TaxID=1457780 RepID=A0A075FTI4_9EURY|nr:hypothetical protein [uncultured marine group II/III euryarchaeote AD1000_49_G12]
MFALALHSPEEILRAYWESPRITTPWSPPSVSNHRMAWAIAESSAVLLDPTSAPRKPSAETSVTTGPLFSRTTSPPPLPIPLSPDITQKPQPAGVWLVTFLFSSQDPST